MMQGTKNTSDCEEWSRGEDSFCITSRSNQVNRRRDLTSKTYQSGSDSDNKQARRSQYTVYRDERKIPNATEIHVDVRPPYPPVEIPIQRISTTGRNWTVSGEPQNSMYPFEPLIVSPPAARKSSRRQQRILRHGSETRVITEMTIPPLKSPNLGRPRNQRSYSSDILRETGRTSQRRQQYEQYTMNNSFKEMNLRDPTGRSQSANRRKKDHHHSRNSYHKHARMYPGSHSRARDIYGTVRGMPMPYPAYPTFAFYPEWAGGYAPVSPAAYYYPEEYGASFSGVPYLSSPAIPIHYSIPRRYPPSTATYGPRSSIQMSAIPTMTPGTAQRFAPVYPRSARPSGQYHCVCCPNGAHQSAARRDSRVFNFEGDQWETDGMPSLNTNQYGRSSLTKSSRSKQHYMETQSVQPHSVVMEPGSRLRQIPNEFDAPLQKEAPIGQAYDLVSPENTFTSQMYQHTWNSITSPKGVLSTPMARTDGFPSDYVDLTDVGIEYTNGLENGEDCDSLPTPDKKVVLDLAEAAILTGGSQTKVAAILKKAMDEKFGPVWHVIAGTGAYGSNIASLGGQLLHFKAFKWAFLIWKTSDQQPED